MVPITSISLPYTGYIGIMTLSVAHDATAQYNTLCHHHAFHTTRYATSLRLYLHLLLQYIFSILQMNILCKINYMYVNLERQKILFIEMVCVGRKLYICIYGYGW